MADRWPVANSMDPFRQRTDDAVLQVIRSFGESGLAGHDLSRQDKANRALAVYRNNFASLVDELLQAMFCPENYRDLRLCAHTSTNVLERVVRETTMLYQQPATRYLRTGADERGRRETAGGRVGELLALSDLELLAQPAGGEEAPDVAGAAPGEAPDVEKAEKTPFDRWLVASDLDGLWAEAHRLARFNPVVWVKPEVRPGEDGTPRLTYDVYTPAAAGVVVSPRDRTQALAWYTWRDEPKNPGVLDNLKAVVTGAEKVETVRVWHVWTATTYYQVNARGQDVRPPEPNTAKRLPVVTVRLGRPTDSYFLDGIGGDLYDATLEICALRSMQNKNFRDMFKQLAIDANPENVPASQVMGNPAMPIYLGEGATAQVLSFEVALEKQSTMVQEREQGIATKYGISPDAWRRSAAPKSGYAQRLDKTRVLEVNQEDRKYISEGEADLYRLCALLSTQEGTSGLPAIGRLDPAAPFVVDHAEPRFDEDPETQIRAEAQEVQLGVVSVLDVVMKRNPDLTEEEAIQVLARNRAINERFLGKKGTALLDLLAAPASSPRSPSPAKPNSTPAGGPPANP